MERLADGPQVLLHFLLVSELARFLLQPNSGLQPTSDGLQSTLAMASNLRTSDGLQSTPATASNSNASNLLAMASNLPAMASNLATASNLQAMASNLLAMASNH